MRVLLTGGAGFIGSWVAHAYIDKGHQVLIIDNLSTGSPDNIPEKAEFIEGDIKDAGFIDTIISDFTPDIINHHAAQIDVRKSVENPVFDAETNILGTINLLEASVKYGVNRFIFSSTGGAIYGEPTVLPADDSTPPMPISPYGVSKYATEKYLEYYHFLHSIDYVALRYANVYGPRQNPHGEAGVIAIFCNKILLDEPCLIFGDGEQTRDYIYVGDVAGANIKAVTAPPGSYNIGTGIETSVNDLIRELKNSSRKDFEVVYAEARAGEVQRISLNAERAKGILSWSPDVNLPEGIQKTWDWFSNRVSS